MARIGATFNLLVGDWYPAVELTTIDPDASNAMLEDLAQGLTDSVSRDGAGSWAGNMDAGAHKITNLVAGSAPADSVRVDQVQMASAFATAWEGASWAAGKMGYATGPSAISLIDTTAYGRALLSWSEVTTSGSINPVTARTRYYVDSGTAARTLTLPASPTDGDEVVVIDKDGNCGANNATIGRNGKSIMGSATDLVLDLNYAGLRLRYRSSTNNWEMMGL